METITIYHNPRCSKSRKALELLQAYTETHNIEIIEYLKHPPTKKELKRIVDALQIPAKKLIRTTESEYGSAPLKANATEKECLEKMLANPKVIQRPIILLNNKAVIGRPPENIHLLFDKK